MNTEHDKEHDLAWQLRRQKLLISEGLLPEPGNEESFLNPSDIPAQAASDVPPSLASTLRELPHQYLLVLTRPSQQTFTDEMSKASWKNTLFQVFLMAFLFATTALIGELLYPSLKRSITAMILDPLLLFLIVLLVFFAVEGMIYFTARTMKGEGSFLAQCYTSALVHTPLLFLISLFLIIPLVGLVIAVIALLYSIVLRVLSVIVAHNLSDGRALFAVLMPMIVVSVFSCCAFSIAFQYLLPHL